MNTPAHKASEHKEGKTMYANSDIIDDLMQIIDIMAYDSLSC